MAKKVSETLAEEMKALQAEVGVINENEDADAAELARADTLLDEYKSKKDSYDKAIAREEQIAEVMRANYDSGNRETPGVQVMKRTDPFDSASQKELGRSVTEGGSFNKKDAISRASAAIEKAHVSDESKQHMFELVETSKEKDLIARHILLCGTEQYANEFEAYMASSGSFTGEAMRTAMSLTGGNGGFLIPTFLDPSIILTNSGVVDPLREASTVRTISSNVWNGVSSAGVTASWLGESVAASDASPSFLQPSITCHKGSVFVQGSYEVLSDSGFSSELGGLIADAKVRLEGAAFATGNTAATKPQGVIAGVAAVTASLVTSATTGAFVIADLYRLVNAVRPRSQRAASFVANRAIYNLVRQFDTSGGGGFWANLGMDRPNELLSAPVYEDSTMASAVANAALVLLLGDLKQYYIIDRIGVSIQYVPVMIDQASGLPNGNAGYFAYWRTGAGVVDADAFRLLQLNQTAAAVSLA